MTCWKHAWLFFWLGVSATMIGTVVYGRILRGRELKETAADEAAVVNMAAASADDAREGK